MNRKHLMFLSCILMALFAINLTIIGPLIMEITRTFSLSIYESGFIFTANFIGFVIFVVLGGILSDRYGKKRVLKLSVSGLTLSLIIFACSSNFIILCFGTFFMGGFGGALESQISALVNDLNSENSGFYVNLTQISFGIGAVIGPIMAGILISNKFSWRICYLTLGILFFINLIALMKSKELAIVKNITLAKTSRGENQKFQIIRLIKNPFFILMFLCMMFYCGAEIGNWGWMGKLLTGSFGYSVEMASLAISVFWTAMTIGRIICGFLTFRFRLNRIIQILAIISGVSTLMIVFINSQIFVWIVIVMMGLFYSSQFPLIIAYAGKNIDATSDHVFSLLIAAGGLGGMIIPYIMGVIGSYFSQRIAMLVPAILLLLIAVIFTFQVSRNRKPNL